MTIEEQIAEALRNAELSTQDAIRAEGMILECLDQVRSLSKLIELYTSRVGMHKTQMGRDKNNRKMRGAICEIEEVLKQTLLWVEEHRHQIEEEKRLTDLAEILKEKL